MFHTPQYGESNPVRSKVESEFRFQTYDGRPLCLNIIMHVEISKNVIPFTFVHVAIDQEWRLAEVETVRINRIKTGARNSASLIFIAAPQCLKRLKRVYRMYGDFSSIIYRITFLLPQDSLFELNGSPIWFLAQTI